MDIQRVKQILSSSDTIQVEYNGVSVWIEQCEDGSNIVQVHDIAYPQESVSVDVAELQEK
jgi:small acid-soluble spore protein H (minor)